MGLTPIWLDQSIGATESQPDVTLILVVSYPDFNWLQLIATDDKNCNQITTDYIWLQKYSKTYNII